MTTPNPNPTAEDVAKLSSALEKAREEHKADKAKHGEFRKALAAKFGLAEDAAPDAILARLGESDAEKIIAERLAPVAKERDEANARAAAAESRWASDRIDRALSDALRKSGVRPELVEPALALARPLFTVDPKSGAVQTKADAANTLPNVGAEAWAFGECRAKFPSFYPPNVSGGARGSAGVGPGTPGDASCFRPGSPTHSMTNMARFVDQHGTEAAIRACRVHGIAPPSWLTRGGAS